MDPQPAATDDPPVPSPAVENTPTRALYTS
jgi:hypothetical protein